MKAFSLYTWVRREKDTVELYFIKRYELQSNSKNKAQLVPRGKPFSARNLQYQVVQQLQVASMLFLPTMVNIRVNKNQFQ